MVTLLKTAKTWKHSRCPSKGEWINKLCYFHTMEYYLAIKINGQKDMEETLKHIAK